MKFVIRDVAALTAVLTLHGLPVCAERTHRTYKECRHSDDGLPNTGKCGPDPMEKMAHTDAAKVIGLPADCGLKENPCMKNSKMLLCFCSDGVYRGESGKAVYSGSYRRGEGGRRLANSVWLDFRLDNEIGDERGYVLELLPSGGGFWKDNPTSWSYFESGNDVAWADHPTVVKGAQLAAEVDGGTWMEIFNNLSIQNGVSQANAQVKLYKTWEDVGLSGDYMTITYMTDDANTIALTNPESMCNIPNPTISAGFKASELVTFSVGATINGCGTSYFSCTNPFTFTGGSFTYNAISCSGTLINHLNVANQWFNTGVEIVET